MEPLSPNPDEVTEKDSIKVILLAEGNERVEVDKDIACMSLFVKSMIDDSGDDEDYPVPNVKKEILEKVIEFCIHLKEEPLQEIEKPLKTNDIKDVVSEWYGTFISVTMAELYDLITAALYLDVKDLVELTSAAVAAQMKGKSKDEIRDLFGYENDFTPEEEEKIREENKWAEEPI